MLTIQEGLRELNDDSINEGRERRFPLLNNLNQLMRLYDFLYMDKDLGVYLYDSHFVLSDQNMFPDRNKVIATDINKQNLERQSALIRYFGKTPEDTPGKNLYAALDIDTYGNKGIINIYGWTANGNARSLSEFKEYLKEFLLKEEGYSEEKVNEDVMQYLDVSSPAVKVLSSKDKGSILQISFALREQAPQMFKRRKI